MEILAGLAVLALLASLFLEFWSRLRPPSSAELPAWSELAAPDVPIENGEPIASRFTAASFPSWLWKLGRFELRVSMPTAQVVERLKERLRAEPGYALFLPIGGHAVGWVQGGRFQVSLIGDFSRRPSSWIADGAMVTAGAGTILRADFVLRKSRVVTVALLAIWILLGLLYAALASSAQSSTAGVQTATAGVIAAVILAAYLSLFRGASWFSGRRLRNFLVEAVSSPRSSQTTEPIGYAAMIRDIEDEVRPRRTDAPPPR